MLYPHPNRRNGRPAPHARHGTAPSEVEVWGGVECTVNRVGDRFFDQLETSGHARRLDDLDRFAGLGLRTLRFPVLWERVAPHGLAEADWSWVDERMGCLRALGLTPIVGFVHHGSGPRETSLIDPHFPAKLSAFARAFAERHPWVEAYTPVNEPLTTARFSGLYGLWYPHGHDDTTFARALVTQCRAVVEAMRAIREVNPAARLVQTEDLGRVWSTPALAYQADFENERRWLTWDLLAGHVGRTHPLWSYLIGSGISARELDGFLNDPCSPDVLGVNHYLTSERFLDERLERYPVHTHGRNGRHRYADVEAVRVLAQGPAGLEALLREAWARYRRPLAVTEVHLGCTVDEQIRWLVEAWGATCAARASGVDMRAVTAWALLGSFDWPSLLTREEGRYEPGVFDVSSGVPRPTPLAEVVSTLARGRRPALAAATGLGWWRRPERILYPPIDAATGRDADPRCGPGYAVTGAAA